MIKRLYMKFIIGFIIMFIPNIKAQSPNFIWESKFMANNSSIEFCQTPINSNMHCGNLCNFSINSDSLHLSPLKLDLDKFSIYEPVSINFISAYENIDTLRSSMMYRPHCTLTSPNINFRYNSRPAILQGFGIVFMGVSRVLLFPSAPDYKVAD